MEHVEGKLRFFMYCSFNESQYFLCVVYSAILSVFLLYCLFNDSASTSGNAVSNHRVIGKDVAKLRYSPGACMQRLRKTTRNLRLFSVPALLQLAHAEY